MDDVIESIVRRKRKGKDFGVDGGENYSEHGFHDIEGFIGGCGKGDRGDIFVLEEIGEEMNDSGSFTGASIAVEAEYVLGLGLEKGEDFGDSI